MSQEPFQNYLREVEVVLREASLLLQPEEIARVRHLIAHGEPAEGLLTLAWILSNNNVVPATDLKSKIMNLVEGSVEDAHMPESFRTPSRNI